MAMELKKEDYVAKIATASPTGLTVITYELLLDHINQARQGSKDSQLYHGNIQKAQEFLTLLLETLDLRYDVAKELFRIYTYVNKLLISASFSKKGSPNTEGLDEAHELLSTLIKGWREIEKNDTASAPLMENTPQLYAGLTYSKGELNEMIVDDPERGYKA